MSMVTAPLRTQLAFLNGKSIKAEDIGEYPVFGSNGKIGFAPQHNHENAIILGRVGAYCGSVFLHDDSFWASDNTIIVKPSEGNLRYWFYLLKHLPLRSYAGGAAQPLLTHGILKGIQAKFHTDLNQQNRIAETLDTYDALIENNRRRIQLLEESARLLYREWFVHLRFPGHEHIAIINDIPAGWEQTSLGQYSKLNYGKALKAENRIEGNFAVYGSSGVVGSHNAGLVKGPTIIVGRKGNVGSVYWSSRDCWPIDTVYFIESDKANLYLYYALQFMQFINTDVAVPGLNRDLAHSRPLMIPSSKILNEFLLAAAPIRQQIEKLEELNQKLAQARDILLPRLMNGELEV